MIPRSLKLLLTSGFLTWLLATGCTTTPEGSESCYCGWVDNGAENPRQCAAWTTNWSETSQQPVLKAAKSDACAPKDCKDLFEDQTICASFVQWEQPSYRILSSDPCFCDFVTVKIKDDGKVACGIWKPGDRFLREYHFTDECNESVCGSSPFRYGSAYCGGKFAKFY